MPEELLTARLRQRPFTQDDADAAFALFAREEVGRFTGGAATEVDEVRALIARAAAHQAAHGFSLWAVEDRTTGELVGEVGLQLLEQRGPEVEIGWSIHPDRWGQGLAREAARAWLDLAFADLGLDEVVAVIRPANASSRALAERLGMAHVGWRRAYGHEHALYVARAPGA